MTGSTDNGAAAPTLRRATRADVPVLLSLIEELAAYEHLTHEVVADAETLTRSLFERNCATEAVIASVDDREVGFVLFFENFSTFLGRPGLYVEDLYVQPEFRGRGIGTALLKHVARLAVERDCGRVEWSVLDWNEPALRFYRGVGAEPLTEWTMLRLTGPALLRFGSD